MKIVLLNGFGLTYNVGDHALLTATIHVITSQFPSARIRVIPWQDPTELMLSNFRRELPRGVDAKLESSVLPAYSGGSGYAAGSLLQKANIALWNAVVNIKAEVLGRALPLAPSSFHAIYEADLVVLRGCNIVQRGSDFRSLLALRRITFPLWLAHRARRPTALLNISVGPIEHPIARRMMRRAAEAASFISAREPITVSYLAKLGQCRTVLSADTAFAFPAQHTPPGKRDPLVIGLNVLSKGEYIAATQGSTASYYAILENLVQQLNGLLRICQKVKILAIPHEMDPAHQNSDVEPLRWLLSRLMDRNRVELFEQAQSAADVIKVYSRCNLAIGMRFHGYVLASLAGTPMLGIDIKSQKVTGVAKSLGLEDFMIDMTHPDQLAELTKKAMLCSNDLQRSVDERAGKLRKVVLDTFASYSASSGLNSVAQEAS